MASQFARYIKEIGRGSHGAKSLSCADAEALGRAVFAGIVPPGVLGAILIALRMKGESLDELLGFHTALTSDIAQLYLPPHPHLTVVIPSYNGARRQPNLLPLLALLLRELGIRVLIHGPLEVAERITTAQILSSLKIQPATSCAEAVSQLATTQLAFLPTEYLSPPLANLLAWRSMLGVRNIAHSLAKLIDPMVGSSLRLVAITHPAYQQLLRELLSLTKATALLLRGAEGEAVASAKRLPAMDRFDAGTHSEFPSLATEGTDPGTANLPSLDAAATADFIQRALSSQPELIPAPILQQAAGVLVAARAADNLDAAHALLRRHLSRGNG